MNLNKIRELTSSNDHTSAYLAGCEYLTERGSHIDNIIQQLRLIRWNREQRGNLDYHDSQHQYVLYGKMLDAARELMTEEEFQEFYMCF